MLKKFTFYPSRSSKIFTHDSYFIPMTSPIILFLFYCVNDEIAMQEWLYIIYTADYVYWLL